MRFQDKTKVESALADLQAAFAAALTDPARAVPEALTSHTGPRPAARFAVYRRNVVASLIQVLEGRFAIVRRLVGDEFFRGLARAYLDRELPASPVLIAYGANFADFIASFPPAAALPYLADVARLEWLQHEAYHAADAAAFDAEALAELLAGDIAATTLALHPALRLFASPFPVLSIWRTNTHDAEVKPVGLDAGPEAVLMLRPGIDVTLYRLPPGGYQFVAALVAGEPLGGATKRALEAAPKFTLVSTLASLIDDGGVVGYTRDPRIAAMPRKAAP